VKKVEVCLETPSKSTQETLSENGDMRSPQEEITDENGSIVVIRRKKT
jgi:hypothetical protein